jgi:hypothetical protein
MIFRRQVLILASVLLEVPVKVAPFYENGAAHRLVGMSSKSKAKGKDPS